MSSILILTGAPGTGKTTLAAHLAKSCERGLHIPADTFFTFPAHPISPYREAAHEQNADIMVGLSKAAEAFASRRYRVLLDGIFGPWFLPLIAAQLRPTGIPVHYVVLRAPLDLCLSRVRERCGTEKDRIVQQMHRAFADLGPFAEHAIDVDGRSVAEVAEELSRCEALGAFRLDVAAMATSGAV